MTRYLLLMVTGLLPITGVCTAITLHDDRGREWVLDAPVQRIVSLAPHLTELLFAAGAIDKLVGTVAYSDYPALARHVPKVGDSSALDLERIVALKPDVVLGWLNGNPPGEIAKLEQLGMKVLVTEPRNMESIAKQIALLGRIAGSERTADAAASRFRVDVDALRHDYQGRRPVSVFYQVWGAPLMTVNGQQIISDVINLCGGQNIFASVRTLVSGVSVEAVLVADPEAIVTGSEQDASRPLDNWLKWKQLRAVRNGNLIVIPSDDISRPTPRLLKGARRLCMQLDRVRHSASSLP